MSEPGSWTYRGMVSCGDFSVTRFQSLPSGTRARAHSIHERISVRLYLSRQHAGSDNEHARQTSLDTNFNLSIHSVLRTWPHGRLSNARSSCNLRQYMGAADQHLTSCYNCLLLLEVVLRTRLCCYLPETMNSNRIIRIDHALNTIDIARTHCNCARITLGCDSIADWLCSSATFGYSVNGGYTRARK